MKTHSIYLLIRNIYLFLFMGVGTILLLVGLYLFSQYVLKSSFLPKYHLGYEERRCNSIGAEVSMSIIQPKDGPAVDPEARKKDAEKRKAECLQKLEEDRAVRKTTDLYNSLTLIALGSLVLGAHLYLNIRFSKKSS